MSYSMPLKDLLMVLGISADVDHQIDNLTIDSRKVSEGSLFFAYPGDSVDGRDFIAAAQAAGATAIVYEATGFELPSTVDVPAFPVNGVQAMVGFVADHFYRQPSQDMQVFGVTGTNGKTTSCYLLTQAFTLLGMEAAMLGTIGAGKLDDLSDSGFTTPDAIAVQQLLARFRDQGITQVSMEVSSHALAQGRVNGVQFFCTVFTNLSHDHLDYHGDMASYAQAKQKLFTDFHSELVVSNAADSIGAALIDIADAEFIVTYGENGDVRGDEIRLAQGGIEMLIETNGVEFEISTPLVGKVNIPNIEMLVATLLALSTSVEDIQKLLRELVPAPGRMELFSAPDKPQVVVDYAHTPDALEKALLSIREHCQGELWCVFGCGGDRDRQKRALMGAAAENHADQLIVTNDNPRFEEGHAIADEILTGMSSTPRVILDRRAAIQTAISSAAKQDWVLIAGKGHETTQQVGDQYLPFSDRKQVAEILGAAA